MERHITIGMDLGDRTHIVVVQDGDRAELECSRIVNTKVSLGRYFQCYCGASVACPCYLDGYFGKCRTDMDFK